MAMISGKLGSTMIDPFVRKTAKRKKGKKRGQS